MVDGYSWTAFTEKWLRREFKIIAIIAPIIAQAIILIDSLSWLFGDGILGRLSMYLAYSGAMLFTVCVAMGNLIRPKIFEMWKTGDTYDKYMENEWVKGLINNQRPVLKRVYLTYRQKGIDTLSANDNNSKRILKTLTWLIHASCIALIGASLITAIRVIGTLIK